MAQLGTIKVQTDSGIVDVPVFDVGDSASSVSEALRVQTDSGEGFVPLVDPADAASPQEAIRVQTDSGIKAVTDSASAIPDGLVDNFNDVGSDSAGIYETGDTIETYYTNNGNNNDIVRSTTEAREGSHGLTIANTNITTPVVYSVPGDGLNAYPQPGDTIRWLGKDSAGAGVVLLAQVEDGTTTPGGYGFEFDAGNPNIEIYKYSDLSAANVTNDFTTISSTSISVSNDVWYWCEADLSSTSDNTLAIRIYQLNADNTRGSLINSTSGSDATYEAERGIGMTTNSGRGGTSIDDVRIK